MEAPESKIKGFLLKCSELYRDSGTENVSSIAKLCEVYDNIIPNVKEKLTSFSHWCVYVLIKTSTQTPQNSNDIRITYA